MRDIHDLEAPMAGRVFCRHYSRLCQRIAQPACRVRIARFWGHCPILATVHCFPAHAGERVFDPRPDPSVLGTHGGGLPFMVGQPVPMDAV